MSDEIEVTERGEIVARCILGEAWTEPHSDGHVWLHVEDEDNARIVASALVSREQLAAWCRRVLREVDPDPVPTVDEAAIRTDERAKAEAEVLSSLRMGAAMWRVALRDAEAVGNHGTAEVAKRVIDTLEWHIGDIRAGKHRSTP